MLTVRSIDLSEQVLWETFLQRTTGATVFATAAWRRTLESGEARVAWWGVFDADELVLGLVAQDKGRWLSRRALMPLLTPHLGILVSPAASPAHLSALGQTLASHYGKVYAVHAPGVTEPWSTLGLPGPRTTLRQTAIIDLTKGEGSLWNAVTPAARRQVKKATRAGWVVKCSEVAAELSLQCDGAYGLLANVWHRRNESCPISCALFAAVFESPALRGIRRFYVATNAHGQVGGFLLTTEQRGTIYYTVAATDAEALPQGVASVLLWHLIQDAAGRGCTQLDLVGANIPSITQFKLGFGPELIEYPATEWISASPRGWLWKLK